MVKTRLWIGVFVSVLCLTGCGDHSAFGDGQSEMAEGGQTVSAGETQENQKTQSGTQNPAAYVRIGATVEELESGFSAVRFEGEDGFDAFFEPGWRGVRPGSTAVFVRNHSGQCGRAFL